MKKFYLFFLLFIFHYAFAQNSNQKAAIDKKIQDVSLISSQQEKERRLLVLQKESEKINYDDGVLQSGDDLMSLYIDQSKYENAIAIGKQLVEFSKNKKDKEGFISNINRKMGLTLGYVGLDNESMKYYQEAIKRTQDITDNDKRNYILSLCYVNKITYFNNKRFENKNLRDSILPNLYLSNEAAYKINDESKTVSANLKYDALVFNNIRIGMFYLEQPEIKRSLTSAEKYLMDALKVYETGKYKILPSNNVMLLNQISWLYMEKKEPEKSIDFANRALELEKKYRDPYHRVESYEFLANGYLEKGEKEKSKFFMDKYSFLKDSLAIVDKNNADGTVQKIVKEESEEHKKNTKKQFLIIGLLTVFIAIVIAIIWRKRSKEYLENYEKLKRKLENKQVLFSIVDTEENNNQNILEYNSISGKRKINAETEERILNDLIIFEQSELFLIKDFSSTALANQLNTNPKYLSEVIKNNRSQNFSDYLNSLRINYIVYKLYNEPKFRDYKISYLAEIAGYASSQVFAIAFKKVNGVTPSYFLQKLKEESDF